jgi:hypothetical protein
MRYLRKDPARAALAEQPAGAEDGAAAPASAKARVLVAAARELRSLSVAYV